MREKKTVVCYLYSRDARKTNFTYKNLQAKR